MKKFIVSLMALLLLSSLFNSNVLAYSDFLDKSSLEDGIVGVTYQIEDGARYKVIISKESETYYYDYLGWETEFYPLQLGNGEYEISLLKNISGSKYMMVHNDTLKINLDNENVVYLQSVQNIRYKPGEGAALKAFELTDGIDNTLDKVRAIYRFIISNIDYDYNRTFLLDKPYIPDIEKTLRSKQGICYDFAALFAAMLRTQEIPAKLVKGYSDNIEGYHSWNEVLIDGNWVTIDTTYDVTIKKSEEIDMIKDKSEYQPKRYY